MSYDALAEVNPRLVMTSITSFGQTGPYRDYRGTDLLLFALSGRMYSHGLPDREPLRYAPEMAWFQAGATAATASMGGLFASRLQGIGQRIDVSAMECLVGNMDSRLLHYPYSGEITQRGEPRGYPYGAYPCADGYVLVSAVNDRFFRRVCRAIGREDMLQDPRWAKTEDRRPIKRSSRRSCWGGSWSAPGRRYSRASRPSG